MRRGARAANQSGRQAPCKRKLWRSNGTRYGTEPGQNNGRGAGARLTFAVGLFARAFALPAFSLNVSVREDEVKRLI